MTRLGHSWRDRRRKSAWLWRKAHFQVKMSENGVSGARLGSSPKPDQVAGAQMGDVHYLSCSHMQWSCPIDRTNLSWEELGNFWGEAAEATNRAGITAKRQRGPGRRGGGGPSREATPSRLLSAHVL